MEGMMVSRLVSPALFLAPALAFGVGKVIKHAVPTRKPRLFGKHAMQSFPSGHSSGVAAFATAFALTTKKPWGAALAVAAIGAMNVDRVVRGEHRVGECIAGDLLGITAALTADAIVTSPSVRRRVQQLRARVAR